MKTELEKMLAGELYDATDKELVEMRLKARDLLAQYNQTNHHEIEKRNQITQDLFGSVGEGLDIQAPFYCDYGSHTFIGNKVFMNFNCVILDCAPERIKGPELAAAITIGNNVWIGGGAIICPGVVIGDNTTIGAGSVVTKDIPANVVAAGNPCRVIRTIHPAL